MKLLKYFVLIVVWIIIPNAVSAQHSAFSLVNTNTKSYLILEFHGKNLNKISWGDNRKQYVMSSTKNEYRFTSMIVDSFEHTIKYGPLEPGDTFRWEDAIFHWDTTFYPSHVSVFENFRHGNKNSLDIYFEIGEKKFEVQIVNKQLCFAGMIDSNYFYSDQCLLRAENNNYYLLHIRNDTILSAEKIMNKTFKMPEMFSILNNFIVQENKLTNPRTFIKKEDVKLNDSRFLKVIENYNFVSEYHHLYINQ